MDLKPNAGSDRAWVWNTLADYADECPKAEFLAIRFLNAESKCLRSTSPIIYKTQLVAFPVCLCSRNNKPD